MKKTIATAVITAIVTAAIAIACFAGCSKRSVKQTATVYLDQEVYNDYLESSKSDANRKDLGGGVLFQDDGQFIHISRIDDSRYFGIFGENTTPSQM